MPGPGGPARMFAVESMSLPVDRIPATLLTGPAGSGKTTLLNRLLRDPAMADTLVVIGEFGATALAHPLAAHAGMGPAGGLASACTCCAVRTDLAATLRDAPWRFSRGGQRLFGRVAIEAAGSADPASLVEILEHGWRIASRYRLDGVVAVVEAGGILAGADVHADIARQVALADRVLVRGREGLDAARRTDLARRLAVLNPAAGPRWQPVETMDARAFTGLRPATGGAG